MAFDFTETAVAVRPEIGDAFRREWARLAAPGASWTGADRVAIAKAARAACAGASAIGELDAGAEEVARRVAAEPATIRRHWVQAKLQAGLSYAQYVEIVGVAARLSAIDAFHRGLGRHLEPLPEPESGRPTGETEPRAGEGRGYVPMVGGTSIVGALSLVPPEMRAQEDLHGPLYLTYEQMQNLDFRRGLHRTQMELIAARVSAVNECFY